MTGPGDAKENTKIVGQDNDKVDQTPLNSPAAKNFETNSSSDKDKMCLSPVKNATKIIGPETPPKEQPPTPLVRSSSEFVTDYRKSLAWQDVFQEDFRTLKKKIMSHVQEPDLKEVGGCKFLKTFCII